MSGQNAIPDVTLVTACYDLSRFHNKCFDIKTCLEKIDTVIKLPVYLVIYTESKLVDAIKEKRGLVGFEHITKYVVVEFEKIWAYQYLPIVNKNRSIFWGTRDERTCSESHIITCNKADFVLQTIHDNPFNTTKFGWLDSFLTSNGTMRICENYNVSKLLYALHNVDEKYHIQVLNVNDKKFMLKENKHEYYSHYRYVVAGGFFTCGRDIGIKILERFKQLFVETTHLGYGHGEEMLYLEILEEFYNDIHKSYGDYGQIINNFIAPTANLYYIYHYILCNYIKYGYHREAYDCASTLLRQFDSYTINMDWNLYMKTLHYLYIAAYYCKPAQETLEIVTCIHDLYLHNPYIRMEYDKDKEMYDTSIRFHELLKPKYDLIIGVYACPTVLRYKNEIRKIEETWGKTVAQKEAKGDRIKIIYFLGEEEVPDFVKSDKFVYLQGVKNDYASASYKQNLGMKYIYEKYDAKFVFMCGTDTFVNCHTILPYVRTCDPEKLLYIGGHGDTRIIGGKGVYYHSGGAGFIVSRGVMQKIYDGLYNMTGRWFRLCKETGCDVLSHACDIAIAYYLQQMDCEVETVKSAYFFGCNYRGCAQNNTFKCCNIACKPYDIITCHFMTPDDFDDYHAILEFIYGA
jgi:hypothetical protein